MRSYILLIASLPVLVNVPAFAQPSFRERQIITTDFYWRTAHNTCTADLDSDGDLDILAANYGGNPFRNNQFSWHKNLDGTGSFGERIIIPLEGFYQMTAVHSADLDGDGDIDFIVSDDSESIAWFENTDGNGTFGSQKILNTSANHINCIQTADVDLDGDLDIIGISYNRVQLVFWLENLDGNGNFSEGKTIYSNTNQVTVEDLAIGDIDGDSDSDITILWTRSTTTSVYCFENLGNGTFGTPVDLGNSPSARSIVLGDIDSDNDPDILSASSNGILLFENRDGQGSFAAARNIKQQTYTGIIYPEDLDYDGDIDLLWADNVNRAICFVNNGTGNFDSQVVLSNSLNEPGVICTGDLDGDGDKDVLIGSGQPNPGSTGSIIWFENITNPTLVQNNQNELTDTFQLYQNYPNPFNPSTTICYSLPQAGQVKLEIYNLLGQKLETMLNEYQTAGEHQLQWKPEDLPSGIYLARLRAGSQTKTMKLVLQK